MAVRQQQYLSVYLVEFHYRWLKDGSTATLATVTSPHRLRVPTASCCGKCEPKPQDP